MHSRGQLPWRLSSKAMSRFYNRVNEALQRAQDKAQPGEMNFSLVSVERSFSPRGMLPLSVLVWLLGVRKAEKGDVLKSMNREVFWTITLSEQSYFLTAVSLFGLKVGLVVFYLLRF